MNDLRLQLIIAFSIAFHAPMYALINLLVYILSNPTYPRLKADLAIMDIGAGHFSQLEYYTDGEVTMPFTKEIAALARVAATRAKDEPIAPIARKPAVSSQNIMNDQITWTRSEVTVQPDYSLDNDNVFDVSPLS